ncbi:hypothetical protein E0H75_03135 [Kribbella capetownensis]|uniref:Acyltransferase n=1 Tax=Kribbella capetownensis TaxID=1572659 RepID=A0A4R0K0M3_9ACTN|nr:acyltransferase domain-containing protein [Kribbella capetownensis]TCC52760.1 hypothetical protein E0H75_03135 [Kribbella capetownensis]
MDVAVDVDGAAQRLGFGAADRAWLRGLPVGEEVQLPDEAESLMEYCGVAAADRREMLAARPDPVRDPDWWAVMSAMAGQLDQEMGQPVPSTGFKAWPTVPASASPVGLFAAAWALLAHLPRLLELHAKRGVPESVSIATVSALGGVMATHRQITGRAGVGLMYLWGPPLRFRGADYEIGRHDFTRAQLGLGDGVSGHVLMMHIPPIGPLDAQASERSVATAAESFARWYPEEPLTAFVCTSWLLDPQLAEYLRPDSNIIRFQRRFNLLPLVPPDDPAEGDRELMRLGLHLPVPDGPLNDEALAQVPQTTTLQRAYVTHLHSGRHWQNRTGILRSGLPWT